MIHPVTSSPAIYCIFLTRPGLKHAASVATPYLRQIGPANSSWHLFSTQVWYQTGGRYHPVGLIPLVWHPVIFSFCAVKLAFFSARAHHTLSTCGEPRAMRCCDQWLLCFVGCLSSPNKHHAALFCTGLLPVASQHLLYLSFPYKQSFLPLSLPFIRLFLFTVWWNIFYLMEGEVYQTRVNCCLQICRRNSSCLHETL